MNNALKTPKVSVVIPCFNHGEFLRDAVESVVKLNRPDVELIVVDDGSTDEPTRTGMVTLQKEGHHVIRQDNNGLAAARNAGILASRGEYILPLDADNRIRRAYIERSIEILDGNPDVGVVYGDAEYIGLRVGRWEVGSFDPVRLLKTNYIDACAVYRRSVWEKNGGYDGGMPVQGLEDWDFWVGALEHGWQFVYVPEILFEYRVSNESMITRARDFWPSLEEFVSRKHGLVYKKAWLSNLSDIEELHRERESIVLTLKNLRRLVRKRLATRARKYRRGQNPDCHDAGFVADMASGVERT